MVKLLITYLSCLILDASVDLEFHNCFDKNLTTIDIQELYPNLNRLKFYSSHIPIPNIRIYTVMSKANLKEIGSATAAASNLSEAPLSYSKSLNNLELHFPVLKNSHINYLAACISNIHLDNLRIVMAEVDLYDWIENVGMETVLGLAHHLSKLKYSQIERSPVQSCYTYYGRIENDI
jgi:hypothetical protein